MEISNKKHTLVIDANKKVTMTGLVGIVSIFEKEIEVLTIDNKIVLKGAGLSASKLDVEDGTLVVNGEFISSVTYFQKNQKITLKGIFK